MECLFSLASHAVLASSGQVMEFVRDFIREGGIFMVFILLCSLVAVFVMIHRCLSLRWNGVLPRDVTFYIEKVHGNSGDAEDLSGLGAVAGRRNTPLSRVVAVAFDLRNEDNETLRGGIETAAREEIVKLQSGLSILEVIITIAPLLGLLGTVSGLISVFGVFGDAGPLADPEPAQIAAGIAEALYTTIAGLAVAVPVVIGHSYLNKKIERMAVRMEVLLAHVVQALNRMYRNQNERPENPVRQSGS